MIVFVFPRKYRDVVNFIFESEINNEFKIIYK
jgi:hypothetical protein